MLIQPLCDARNLPSVEGHLITSTCEGGVAAAALVAQDPCDLAASAKVASMPLGIQISISMCMAPSLLSSVQLGLGSLGAARVPSDGVD